MNDVKLNVSESRGYEGVDLIKVENKDGVAVVSSRVVANDFVKEHRNVLQSVDNLIVDMGGAEKSADLFIESQYQHPQNKQWYKEYLLTRDGFSLLVMGFTGKEALQWKLKYIEAFNKMEEMIKQAVANPYANLSPELQMLIKLEQGHKALERNQTQLNNRVLELEENAPLSPSEYGLVSKRVSQRVYEVQRERQMSLEQKQIGELFRALNRDILEITGVKTRTQLRQKHLDMVLVFINDWYPSRAVMFNINQMSLAI